MSVSKDIMWKNQKGYLLENDSLITVILPSMGGKIVSLREKTKDFELAAQYAGDHYEKPSYGSSFEAYDASGLDDAFPNIDQEEYQWNGDQYCYPDHGEIWSCTMKAETGKDGLKLFYESPYFDYTYEKVIRLEENRLVLEYEIQNSGTEPIPCIWTFHGLLRYEEDMEFFYGSDVSVFRNVFENEFLGQEGLLYEKNNPVYDFGKVPKAHTRSMVKYYVEGAVTQGICGCRYPSAGITCRYLFDPEKLPYLGIWITAGGFRGDYNCAIEPSNGFYDSISKADKNKKLFFLENGKPLKFSLEIQVEANEIR
ncbi:MAG: DUF5107 domain-containing protein [Blautia sp.]|nr:DUF5107 domain-containing protein [Blautia sp.]MDY3998056.1 DUF5107 domain-containing protein [Blautia sp.]